RLNDLSSRLGGADWLDGAFSAGDLLMVSVLLRLKASSQMLDAYPNLSAYVARGEARPAYHRAFAAQLAVFTAGAAKRRLHASTRFKRADAVPAGFLGQIREFVRTACGQVTRTCGARSPPQRTQLCAL